MSVKKKTDTRVHCNLLQHGRNIPWINWQKWINTEMDKKQVFKSYGSTGASPVKGQDDDEGTRVSLMQKKKDWELGFFSLEMRRLGGNVIYLKGRGREESEALKVGHSDRGRSNGHKLEKTQEICSELQETLFLTVWVTRHQHKLSRKVECLSFEIFKSHLNMILGNRF